MNLVLPSLGAAVLRLVRRRAAPPPAPAARLQGAPAWSPAPVPPQPTALPLREMIAACRRHMAQHEQEPAIDIATELSAVHPSTEAEWTMLGDLFRFIKRPAWEEIACARFIAVEPQNTAAQLRYTWFLCPFARNRATVDRLLATLEATRGRTEAQTLVLADIYKRMRDGRGALATYRRMLDENPGSFEAARQLVSCLIDAGQGPDAAGAYATLCRIMPQSALWHVIAAELAVRLKDTGAVLAHGAAAEALITASDVALRLRLVEAYLASGEPRRAAALLGTVDIGAIAHAGEAAAFFRLAERCGSIALTIRACARQIDFDPASTVLRLRLDHLRLVGAVLPDVAERSP